MLFKVSLLIAVLIFLCGLSYKISGWFRYNIGIMSREVSPIRRFLAALKGISLTLLSPKILVLIKVIFLDILLQRRIFQQDRLRWLMHITLFSGFLYLFFFHALGRFITASLFPDYASRLNPFLFLRNLSFLMVIIGLGIAIYRRKVIKIPRFISNSMDHYTLILLAIIMLSGILLEGVKIGSYTTFLNMIEDYSDTDDEEELRSLENYWVKNYGIVIPDLKKYHAKDTLSPGVEIHEMNCAACHSRPYWAPVSYGISRIIRPVGAGLDRIGIPAFLWFVHYMACFIGLAYLPFSKMFHIFVSPLSLMVNAVMGRENSDPANIATRQIMELDACTHCGNCSINCSVGITLEEIQNINILPSEKLISIKALARGKSLRNQEIRKIQEGLNLCTNCHRCTDVCPVGINLQEMWFESREALFEKNIPEWLLLSPLSLYRGLNRDKIQEERYLEPLNRVSKAISRVCNSLDDSEMITEVNINKGFQERLATSYRSKTFNSCFNCHTCSAACPVVLNYDNPTASLGLVPHQIIHAAVFGLSDMVYRSNMLWSCLGCYACQDVCPQGVHITDVFYELKNLAIKHLQSNYLESTEEV